MSEPMRKVDVRPYVCPMTWVRVKLALEATEPGGLLEVTLQGDEPLRNLPRSAAADGHTVISCEPAGEAHVLLLRRQGC